MACIVFDLVQGPCCLFDCFCMVVTESAGLFHPVPSEQRKAQGFFDECEAVYMSQRCAQLIEQVGDKVAMPVSN